MYSQTTRLMDAGRSIQAAVVRADLFIVCAECPLPAEPITIPLAEKGD